MRQVPHYLIIGNGRMAKHLCHYLTYLKLPYVTWARSENPIEIFSSLLSKSTHVLILINDNVIDEFIQNNIRVNNSEIKLIHFSGNYISKQAYSAHPLQTFTAELYPQDDYKKIPFIIESEGPEFSELLPGFENPHYRINQVEKNYYHALCVMANNFTVILWQKFLSEMQNKFKVDIAHLQPFLDQTFHNIKYDFKNALTGPISRKDKKTLENDLKSLKNDNFFNIFDAFTKTFIEEQV
ncbi:MAG: DUF2520 domain-containing protein [Gammaproteobacteria bacterium]|nr:DUF2520 domain-containing protein [Gammaproteobacteria bacterium]